MIHAKWAALFMLPLAGGTAAGEDGRLDTVVVTGQRAPVSIRDTSLAVTRIESSAIDDSAHNHANELAVRAPGAWISRGSGQEHLTAIRSPVLTGAGSCGAFLVLEDGIPIRPAGFCNVNELFEINTEQAGAIEIARGPVSAVWGANALHGAINVLMDTPRDTAYLVGTGPDDYYRARLATGIAADGVLLVNVDHDGGFRRDSGYDQGKLNVMLGGEGLPRFRFSATRLQQETAGFAVGDDAYRDATLRKSNPNPEAFRDADSQRLSVSWDGDWDVTAYARHSRMRFLQHFLPGQPLERNGQRSLGLSAQRAGGAGKWSLLFGIDAEAARGRLSERQNGPTMGSDFLRETRPAGTHYDYTADSALLGLWLHAARPINDRWSLQAAARAETLYYDYDNRAANGNLRDDGSACGFGGCLYNRPADRSDRFSNIAPRIALNARLAPGWRWWAQAASGFRPPQATELYRLQRNQEVAQLDAERLDSLETGLRYLDAGLKLETVGYTMRKKRFIFRDAAGVNVSDGRTRHHGIESSLRWQIGAGLSLEADVSLALHRYDFDRSAGGGETIVSGAKIDTAPRRLGGARLLWRGGSGRALALEWLHTGSYSMDAANTTVYPGHDLLNLRYTQPLGRDWTLHTRLMNLADTRYAERADFAFGNERYFPGLERRVYVDLRWHPLRP